MGGFSDIIGSLGFDDWHYKHMSHLAIVSSISFPIPGQNKTSLALCLHLTTPRWLA